ncbi:B-cell receptor CD22-like, partial [Poecilia formosa]|uniref:B-cell receptor CD22-like n=1 Tax=Poecilia formosa TaxID=48698 RepID=UPI0007B835D0
LPDSPWSPSINVPSDLKEHQSVTVTCSAFTPCPHSPPELTWTLQQDSLRQTEKNTDGTFTTKIQENITLSDTHDGYNIRCSARYPVIGGIKTAETEVTLSVSYAPRNTSASISPSGLVSAGSWVELSCSSRAKPPPRFTWFRISRDGDMNVSVGQIFSFNVTEGGEFHCVATNHLGNDSSSRICVTTEDSPWSPSINVPSDLKEHQSVTVTCSAFTPCPHSPPQLTWNLQQDSLRQTEKNTDGTFTAKIQENITLSDTHDGYNITCSARYPVIGGNKTAGTEVTLSVSYAPRNTSASISPSGLVSAGSWVELSCSSRAKPPPRFTWFWISKHGAVNVSVGPVYNLQMTNMTNKESYFCVAANILGNQTSSWIHLKNKETGMQTVLASVVLLFIYLAFISLVSSVCFFKSKHRTPQQTQAEPDEDVTVQVPPDKTEELDYEDMNFFQRRSEAFYASMKDRGQEDAVYAQVKKSRPRNSSVRTVDSSEDIYIEMKQQ